MSNPNIVLQTSDIGVTIATPVGSFLLLSLLSPQTEHRFFSENWWNIFLNLLTLSSQRSKASAMSGEVTWQTFSFNVNADPESEDDPGLGHDGKVVTALAMWQWCVTLGKPDALPLVPVWVFSLTPNYSVHKVSPCCKHSCSSILQQPDSYFCFFLSVNLNDNTSPSKDTYLKITINKILLTTFVDN